MLAKIIINKQLTTFVTVWQHMYQVRRECVFNNTSFSPLPKQKKVFFHIKKITQAINFECRFTIPSIYILVNTMTVTFSPLHGNHK